MCDLTEAQKARLKQVSEKYRKLRARCSQYCATWNSEDRDCEIYGCYHPSPSKCPYFLRCELKCEEKNNANEWHKVADGDYPPIYCLVRDTNIHEGVTMFEKEAEEILNNHCDCELLPECMAGIRRRCSDFEESKELLIEGIEFGYNKANEWHYVKDGDLPKDCKGKLYLVNIYSDSQLKFEYAEYTPTVCLWNPEWKRFEILELTVGSRIVNIRNIIAWKEIVLPELPKEN